MTDTNNFNSIQKSATEYAKKHVVFRSLMNFSPVLIWVYPILCILTCFMDQSTFTVDLGLSVSYWIFLFSILGCYFKNWRCMLAGVFWVTAGYHIYFCYLEMDASGVLAEDIVNAIVYLLFFIVAFIKSGAIGAIKKALSARHIHSTQVSGEWVCPKCQRVNQLQFAFCGNCGARRPEKKICIRCKAALESDSRFCPHCGAEQAIEEIETVPVNFCNVSMDNDDMLTRPVESVNKPASDDDMLTVPVESRIETVGNDDMSTMPVESENKVADDDDMLTMPIGVVNQTVAHDNKWKISEEVENQAAEDDMITVPVNVAYQETVNTNKPVQNKSVFCPYCGEKNSCEFLFCVNCGHKLK